MVRRQLSGGPCLIFRGAHKNIQEVRNLMLDEVYFPYVIFLQGSNFATTTFFVETSEG